MKLIISITAKRYFKAFEFIKKELGKYRLAYLTPYVLNQALLRIAQKVNSKDALRNYQKVIRSFLQLKQKWNGNKNILKGYVKLKQHRIIILLLLFIIKKVSESIEEEIDIKIIDKF